MPNACSKSAARPLNVQTERKPELFRVRAGRRADTETIGALLRELGYPDAADVATVHWVISHPEMEIIVAADGRDRAIGMVTLSHRPQLRMKGRIATIDELIVTEPWRRRGVGRELLRHAIQRAKVLCVKRLELLTPLGRAQVAHEFYKGCGFSEADSLVMRFHELDFSRQ